MKKYSSYYYEYKVKNLSNFGKNNHELNIEKQKEDSIIYPFTILTYFAWSLFGIPWFIVGLVLGIYIRAFVALMG